MNTYTMVFAVTPDFKRILLLRKPNGHHNPLFRDRWTAPGGHIEDGEMELQGALREMREETLLEIAAEDARFVLRFACNCDPLESEHEVIVYGATVPLNRLILARGEANEPVAVWPKLPGDVLWYVDPLLEFVKGRLKQPL